MRNISDNKMLFLLHAVDVLIRVHCVASLLKSCAYVDSPLATRDGETQNTWFGVSWRQSYAMATAVYMEDYI